MQYRHRVMDDILAERLECSGAVLVEGAKWCGKTTMCEQHAKSVIYMTDPDRRAQYIQIADTEVSRLLVGDSPRLIDEWQDVPKVWDAIRHIVDRRGTSGNFILTGSAVVPTKKKLGIKHSGTGRFSWLKMRPMSLWESGESSGEASLKDLFAGEKFSSAHAKDYKLGDMALMICRGGWPRAVGLTGASAIRQVREYYKAVTESDVSRFDDVPRDPERVRNLMRSYARLQGTQANLSAIRRDMSAHDAKGLSEDTIRSYINALKGIFVIEDMPSWSMELRSKDSVRVSDTRFFTDPSIAATALGATPDSLVNDLRTYGYFFEALAIRDLRIYMDVFDGEVLRYRDKTGLECDAILRTWDGQYALVEIKLGGDTLVEEGAASLTKLSDLIVAKGKTPPAFKMVLTAVGEFAYRRKDGIVVCPLGALKP